MFLAAGEVSQGEGFNVRWYQSDLGVNGAARFQLLVIIAPDGVQHVRVNVAHREGFVKDGGVQNKTDFGIARPFDIGDSGEVEDGIGHVFVIVFVHRYDDIEVPDGVFSSSCTAR